MASSEWRCVEKHGQALLQMHTACPHRCSLCRCWQRARKQVLRSVEAKGLLSCRPKGRPRTCSLLHACGTKAGKVHPRPSTCHAKERSAHGAAQLLQGPAVKPCHSIPLSGSVSRACGFLWVPVYVSYSVLSFLIPSFGS